MASDQPQARVSGDDVVIALPTLFVGLPDTPPAHLDPYLDAAGRCFARFGVSRTSVQDVAKEMGYNRATVYKQVGTIENQIKLLAARDLYRSLAEMPNRLSPLAGPELIIELVAAVVEEAWEHPVLAKVLADEPELLTALVSRYLPEVRDRVVEVIGPLLAAAMDDGRLARRNPTVVASLLTRLIVTLIALPPETDLRSYLTETLSALLTPTTSADRSGPSGS